MIDKDDDVDVVEVDQDDGDEPDPDRGRADDFRCRGCEQPLPVGVRGLCDECREDDAC